MIHAPRREKNSLTDPIRHAGRAAFDRLHQARNESVDEAIGPVRTQRPHSRDRLRGAAVVIVFSLLFFAAADRPPRIVG